MISNDISEEIMSETSGEQMEHGKYVPVTESIRYRKRAQSAEKEAEILAEQLTEAKGQMQKMAEQLNEIQLEQKLARKLAAVGAIDIEAATLIAKARVSGNERVDIDGVVEQLKKEKRYLFGNDGIVSASRKTAGARGILVGNSNAIQRAARKATTSGSRTDLQEYLKLRRNVI